MWKYWHSESIAGSVETSNAGGVCLYWQLDSMSTYIKLSICREWVAVLFVWKLLFIAAQKQLSSEPFGDMFSTTAVKDVHVRKNIVCLGRGLEKGGICYSFVNLWFFLATIIWKSFWIHFSVALRPQKPWGLLGTGSPGRPPRLHTAPELWSLWVLLCDLNSVRSSCGVPWGDPVWLVGRSVQSKKVTNYS